MTKPLVETWYLALTKLKISNAPGTVPSSVRVEVGQRVALDGTESMDLPELLKQGALRLYGGTPEEDAFIEQMAQLRTVQATKEAKRPARKRRGMIDGKPAV
jgi:hypothetical protein